MRKGHTNQRADVASDSDDDADSSGDKLAIRRAKNREAARRVRERRVNAIKSLTEQVEQLVFENTGLREQMKQLEINHHLSKITQPAVSATTDEGQPRKHNVSCSSTRDAAVQTDPWPVLSPSSSGGSGQLQQQQQPSQQQQHWNTAMFQTLSNQLQALQQLQQPAATVAKPTAFLQGQHLPQGAAASCWQASPNNMPSLQQLQLMLQYQMQMLQLQSSAPTQAASLQATGSGLQGTGSESGQSPATSTLSRSPDRAVQQYDSPATPAAAATVDAWSSVGASHVVTDAAATAAPPVAHRQSEIAGLQPQQEQYLQQYQQYQQHLQQVELPQLRQQDWSGTNSGGGLSPHSNSQPQQSACSLQQQQQQSFDAQPQQQLQQSQSYEVQPQQQQQHQQDNTTRDYYEQMRASMQQHAAAYAAMLQRQHQHQHQQPQQGYLPQQHAKQPPQQQVLRRVLQQAANAGNVVNDNVRFKPIPEGFCQLDEEPILMSTDFNLNTSDLNIAPSLDMPSADSNAMLASEEILRHVPLPEEAAASRSAAWL